jgi:hypothetical protein
MGKASGSNATVSPFGNGQIPENQKELSFMLKMLGLGYLQSEQ